MGKSKIDLIKHSFFNKSLHTVDAFSFADSEFDLDQLKFEFSNLYQLFLSNKVLWAEKAEIIFYMNYLCNLLIRYYEHDYVCSELQNYKKKKDELDLFIQEHFVGRERELFDGLADFLLFRQRTNVAENQEPLAHISTLRNHLDNMSSTRSRWGYSRSLAMYAIDYLQASSISDLIQEFNALLGNQYSFVDGINFINQSREIMAILGIVLYTVRFIINLALLLKHVIQASTNEELSVDKILKQELAKRGFIMSSDLVWSVVTLITTYNEIFFVTSSAVPILIGSFLIFDALLILVNWYYEASLYNARLQELVNQLKTATVFEQEIIHRQLDLLNDEWEAQSAYYLINILGACILAMAYAATFVFTGTVAIAALALCSMLGNALYNTSNSYKQYIQAKTALRRETLNDDLDDDAHHQKLLSQLGKEVSETFGDFCKSLAFNVGGIAFIITAAVASWPIALCLAVSYICYQLYNTYQKHVATNNVEMVEHDVYRQMAYSG